MKRIVFLSTFLLTTLISCVEDSNEQFKADNFTAFFDNDQFSSEFRPIDIIQTPDEGFIVLADRNIRDSNFKGIYLLKADRCGSFVSAIELDDQYVHAIKGLTQIDNAIYFFGMESNSARAVIFKTDEALTEVQPFPTAGLTYPMAATHLENAGFAVLSYNNIDRASVISLVGLTANVSASRAYSIGVGEDVEEPIINHFLRTGRQFPFAVGRTGSGQYYFNGFYNYTFSLVFVNFSQDDPTGVIQGQQDDGGFSAVYPLQSNRFSLARFDFGSNYLLPTASISVSGISSAINLGGYKLPELVANSPIVIKSVTVDTRRFVLYGGDTNAKQIGLFLYNEDDGKLAGTHYLGFANPFEIGSFTQTKDNGLAVCGTIYIAGRFPRVAIFKFSRDQLAQMAKT